MCKVNRDKEANAVVLYTNACSMQNKRMQLLAKTEENNATAVGVTETRLSETDYIPQYYIY